MPKTKLQQFRIQKKELKENVDNINERYYIKIINFFTFLLCNKCQYYSNEMEWCNYNLVPITTEGKKCPYFKEVVNE